MTGKEAVQVKANLFSKEGSKDGTEMPVKEGTEIPVKEGTEMPVKEGGEMTGAASSMPAPLPVKETLANDGGGGAGRGGAGVGGYRFTFVTSYTTTL